MHYLNYDVSHTSCKERTVRQGKQYFSYEVWQVIKIINFYFTYRHVLLFKNSRFCPHRVLRNFVWISEQTAIISINSIN